MEFAVFAALADPTRRAVVARLAYGPATAGQLAELAQMSRPAVSQHVRVLREAGVIRGERSGKFIWYGLEGTALVEAERWLRALVDIWAAAPTLRVKERTPCPSPFPSVDLTPPARGARARFFEAVFDWEFQPFASQDYLVAPRGHAAGIDTGLMPSQDGAPRAIPILRVDSIDAVREALEAAGGTIVVEPFEFPGVGRGCY